MNKYHSEPLTRNLLKFVARRYPKLLVSFKLDEKDIEKISSVKARKRDRNTYFQEIEVILGEIIPFLYLGFAIVCSLYMLISGKNDFMPTVFMSILFSVLATESYIKVKNKNRNMMTFSKLEVSICITFSILFAFSINYYINSLFW